MASATEQYLRSQAKIQLENVPPTDSQADYVPPPATNYRDFLSFREKESLKREERTPEERAFEMFSNLMAPELMGPLGLTRTEALRAVSKGLKLKNILPKKDLIERVREAQRGILGLADEELAPINSITWEPQMDAFTKRAAGQGPYGVTKGTDIYLNPTKASSRGHRWTMTEEAMHVNQFEDSDFWLAFQRLKPWLKSQVKSSGGKFDEELSYIFDPIELHAKYQTSKRLKDYPNEIPPDFMRDVYYEAGLDHIRRSLRGLAKDQPDLAPVLEGYAEEADLLLKPR